MTHATFACPDLTAFCRLDELGLVVTGQRPPDRQAGRRRMQQRIAAISSGVPTTLTEVTTLGRTLKRRAADVVAYFDRPGTSNGPTEAINGRLEHLRGSALGFRKPHPHRPLPPGGRRIQTPTAPCFVKSQIGAAAGVEDQPVYASAFRPDGRVLAIGSSSGQIALWDVSDPGQPQQTAVVKAKAAIRPDRGSGPLAHDMMREVFDLHGAPEVVHADRGTSMTSKTVAALLADLEITRSHSRPKVSNDNPYSEAWFKTLKYAPVFPERFGSLADARGFMARFVAGYNHHHHTGIGLHTPADVHYGLPQDTAANAALRWPEPEQNTQNDSRATARSSRKRHRPGSNQPEQSTKPATPRTGDDRSLTNSPWSQRP